MGVSFSLIVCGICRTAVMSPYGYIYLQPPVPLTSRIVDGETNPGLSHSQLRKQQFAVVKVTENTLSHRSNVGLGRMDQDASLRRVGCDIRLGHLCNIR